MKLIPCILLLSGCLVLLGCAGSKSDKRYLDTRVLPNLEIPPDLTRTIIDAKFEIPKNFSAPQGTKLGSSRVPVLAKVESMRLEGAGDYHWLVVEETAEKLYPMVREFWSSEGFPLAVDEPAIGIMQTEWVLFEEGAEKKDLNFIQKLFASKDLSASQEQYRTRIAVNDIPGTSSIYISHRGTEYQHKVITARTVDTQTPNDWSFRSAEPEREVEMLSRLMIFLGLNEAEIDIKQKNIKLLSPRATLHVDNDNNETYILLKDVYSRAWYRTLHQLDRLNIEVVNAQFKSGLSSDGVIEVKTNFEIEEEASGIFSSSKTIKMVKKPVSLILSKETHEMTRISIETPEGEVETTPEGISFLTQLYEYIK